jgi:hypothetical protein
MGHLWRTARISGPGLSAVIVLSMLLAGCSDGAAPATIDSYATDSAGTTLTFDVVARPGATVQAEVVTQDSSGVVVTVRTREPEGANLDLGKHYHVTVRLDAPLGPRTVRTDDGTTVPTATPT